ncbi:LacI family DNA-binding transcriptional regulator [Hymenobacter sediminicola]|uniref:LacI family DNA-binding transcriptional regulator n=1 Tax=Hymenobacter sediminicola TaxID=2761579 RepID=A0A7G7W3U4_9BACT|nr:LacI family DNA-binding transcriptional regulator [Hymenobacter sediminicola]QNH61037.1 LacI family DNA-binding transcriptional regulator [Hymenobacter sediminicola]
METFTIKDIARELNISTSTVSRALRGSYEINPETKRLVMECAERLNYRPNPIALSLKGSASRAIGVIVPQIANYFFSQAINGIEAIAYNRGYHVIIFQSQESYEREVANVQQALSRKVDGLLISLSSETSDVTHLQELQDKNVPLVLFDRVSPELEATQIVADNFGGAFSATEHLIQSGRRRIAHLTIQPWLSITRERLAGYRAALEKYGLEFDETLVRYGTFGPDEVGPMVDELMHLESPPDAFFTASDRLAVGCLQALRQRKLQIPEDVSLIGFTNLNVADLLDPSLSTVVQPATEIGQVAAERLIDLIERKHRALPIETVKIPTELIVRSSTRLAGQEQPLSVAHT